MPRLLMPAVIVLSLAACSPPAAPPIPPAPTASPVAPVAPSAMASSAVMPVAAPAHAASPDPAPVAPAGGGIEGIIHVGNRPPPALRVCAHPVAGGTPTCVETAAGAASYRIDVVPGRYVVSGRAQEDAGMAFAHAQRIRCIRAPCPPDTAIVVEVRSGQTATDINLSPGEALPPT